MAEEASIATEAPAASPEVIALNTAIDAGEPGDNTELNEDGTPKAPPKPEKTEAERERARMQRGIDRRTRQLAEARAALAQERQMREQLTNANKGIGYQEEGDDSEPLSLTRGQIRQMVTAEAQRLAQTTTAESSERELKQSVVASLTDKWGQEKFNAVASDLDDAFGGLTDHAGRAKPSTEAVFYADDPARVIEYLADPEHAGDAERISRMSAVQAGKEIAKLEARFAATDAAAKPKASNRAAPIEPIKGRGPAGKDLLSAQGDDFARIRREQIRQRR